MPKFSDSNYDILQEYFNEILGDTALGEGDSWLHGPKTGVIVDGGVAETLYEDNATRGFVAHKFIIREIDGNKFKMEYDGLVSTFSLASSAFEIGNDMYFRKDSVFYTYLENNSEEFRNYINTERTFCYFGKIWPVTKEPGIYNIQFEGMKDYMTNALPVHNRTDRLTELIKLWFDGVNHEPYNMTKYLWSLLDAREVDTRWLQYIANIYGIEINDDLLGELSLREWVDFMVYFLKRVGTYNALYIVWRVFAPQSTNAFNVYERWDEWCKTNGIPSYSEFPNFHPGITSTQYDFHWLNFYGITPSGGAGDEWYAQFVPSGFYPYPSTAYPTHALSASCPSSASMALTPHYIVEVDLTTQPLGDLFDPASDEIISELRATELERNWNYTKPVGKYVQYQELIAPLAQEDRVGESINLYPNSSLGFCETYFVGSQWLVNDSPTPSGGEQVHVHVQAYDSNKWSFTHNLSGSILVQTWGISGTGYRQIVPDEITLLSDIAIQIDFGDADSGIAVVAGELPPITDVTNIVAPSATWVINHGLVTAAPSGYPSAANTQYWSSDTALVPSASILTSDDITTATWTSAITGSAFSRLVDYEHIQAVASTTWNIAHNMNSLGPITYTYDTAGEYISPIEVICVDSDNIKITFTSAVAGVAELIYAPRDFISVCDDVLDIMDNCMSPNSGYWQVGNGPTEEYDPFATGTLESPTASGAYWRVWDNDTTWFIDFIVPVGENLSITEVGLFNLDGLLIYYTKCSQLYKTAQMQTVFHYRSQKLEKTESSSSSSSSVSSSSSSTSSSSSSSSVSSSSSSVSSSSSSTSSSSSSESSSSTSSSSSFSDCPVSVDDDFTGDDFDVPNTNRWTLSALSGPPSSGVYIKDNQLYQRPQPVDVVAASTKYTLCGDFRAETDWAFDNSVILNFDSTQFQFGFAIDGIGGQNYVYIMPLIRRVPQFFEQYTVIVGNSVQIGGDASSLPVTAGRLRIDRVGGNTINVYDDQGAGWTLVATASGSEPLFTDSGSIVYRSLTGAPSNPDNKMYWDNLTVVGDCVSCASSSSSTSTP